MDIFVMPERNVEKKYNSDVLTQSHFLNLSNNIVSENKSEVENDIVFGNDSYDNESRGVMFNIVAFDEEIIVLFTEKVGIYKTVGAIARASNYKKYFMPTVVDSSTEQSGIFVLDFINPSTDSIVTTLIDPSEKETHDVFYHNLATTPSSWMNAKIYGVGHDLSALFSYASAAYSWFDASSATEEYLYIPAPNYPQYNSVQYTNFFSGKFYKSALGYSVFDGNSVDLIESNTDVIRSNKYAPVYLTER